MMDSGQCNEPNSGKRTIQQKEPVADLSSLLKRFTRIRVWTGGVQPSRYKPLVLLMALGKFSQGDERISFHEVDDQLPKLAERFLHGNSTPRPEQPFWRLRNDGVWIVESEKQFGTTASGDPNRTELVEANAFGRFSDDVLAILKSDPRSTDFLAGQLLASNFPHYQHLEILEAVGLTSARIVATQKSLKRTAEFRKDVLAAYQNKCCVCGYDVHLAGQVTGLEAAHIRAVYANGPNRVPNGLSLCVMHHIAFDRGAFMIQDDKRTIACSQQLTGTSRLEWLTDFHGQKIAIPIRSADHPCEKHLKWHRDHAFLQPERNQMLP